MFVVANMKADS